MPMLALAVAITVMTAPDSLAPASPPPRDSARAVATPADTLPARLVERAVLVAHGDARGQVITPAGLTVDAFGRVYVSDLGMHRIQQLDETGAFRWEAGSLGSDPGQLRRPTSLAMLGTLSVVVLDVENRRISSFDLFGRHTGTLVDLARIEADDPTLRIDPVAMASDRGGALVLADAERDRLMTFDFSGRFTGSIGGFGSKPGSFRGLRGLAVTARGVIVTAERTNARIQRLDAGGRVLAWWPLTVAPGRARVALAADDAGRVVVADEASGKLWVFEGDGVLIAALAGLQRPSALAWAKDGTVLVTEGGGGRVRRFALESQPAPAER